jgi:hypothetical protein
MAKKDVDIAAKTIDEWIKSNKKLFDSLSEFEQAQLKGMDAFAKGAKKATMTGIQIRDIAKETKDALDAQGKSSKEILKIKQSLGVMGAKALILSGKSDALSKKQFKIIEGTVDLTKDYLANVEAIGTEEFISIDFNRKIREAVKAKLYDEADYLRSLKIEHDVQKQLNNEIKTQADLIKKPFDWLDDKIKQIPILGEVLSAKFNISEMGKKQAEGFVDSITEGLDGSKKQFLDWNKFRTSKKGQGLSPGEMSKAYKAQGKGMGKLGPLAIGIGIAIGGWAVSTLKFARELGVARSELSLGMLLFKEETKAVLDEFGSLRDVSDGLLFNMKWQSFWTGVQATDMAKVMMLQQSITGDTKEMALDRQAQFMKEIKSEGLSASKIMGDLASHADMFANFAKDGGKNMEEAAKQAASMGLSLDATSSVAESLLDWESSIAAEMEASVLLGRQINLDKARSLAYSGDLAEMMTEVKNQAGGEAEFAKMSVVQRQTLGGAIGLQGAQLAEFMKTEEERTKELNNSLWKKLGLFTAIATVLGALVGMIVVGLKGMKGSIDLKRGAKQGMGYGLGAGVAASGAYGIYAKGRAQGGPVRAGSPYIVGERGSELFVPTSAGSIIPHAAGGAGPAIDNSDITSRMDKQFEQNERLFRKLGSQFEYGTGQH